MAADRTEVAGLGERRIGAADRIGQVGDLDRTVLEGDLHSHHQQVDLTSHLCCHTSGQLRREGASRSRDRGSNQLVGWHATSLLVRSRSLKAISVIPSKDLKGHTGSAVDHGTNLRVLIKR